MVAHSECEVCAWRSLQMASISFCGKSRVFCISINDDSAFKPGGSRLGLAGVERGSACGVGGGGGLGQGDLDGSVARASDAVLTPSMLALFFNSVIFSL